MQSGYQFMWLARVAGALAAAVTVGLLAAPGAARAQPLPKELTICLVQDRANAVNYLTRPFEAIDQPRALFYANQFKDFVAQNYSLGSLDSDAIGCNSSADGYGRDTVMSDFQTWVGKDNAQLVLLDFHPREEAPAPKAEEVVIDERGNVAALAIDRRSGDRFGWAIDYEDRDAADARALAECRRLGGECHVVLRFTGGCGAYAVQAGSDAVYGWGTNTTRPAAESRARDEVRQRGGDSPVIRVWGCNSVKPQPAVVQKPLPDLAQPAAPPVDRQEREAATLNAKVTAANAEVERRNAAAKADYEAAQAKFEAARAKYEAEQAAFQAQTEAANAAKAQYEADKRAWEAKVAACNAGDVAACAP